MMDSNFNLKLADFGFSTSQSESCEMRGTPGYMAPEIEMNQPYSGMCADLFSAGVILFVMRTGHPPFASSKADDPVYSQMCVNRLDKFWKENSKQHSEKMGFFKPEFMSLISTMMQFDPSARLTLSEIKAHPWYNGEMPTSKDIFEEFT